MDDSQQALVYLLLHLLNLSVSMIFGVSILIWLARWSQKEKKPPAVNNFSEIHYHFVNTNDVEATQDEEAEVEEVKAITFDDEVNEIEANVDRHEITEIINRSGKFPNYHIIEDIQFARDLNGKLIRQGMLVDDDDEDDLIFEIGG